MILKTARTKKDRTKKTADWQLKAMLMMTAVIAMFVGWQIFERKQFERQRLEYRRVVEGYGPQAPATDSPLRTK